MITDDNKNYNPGDRNLMQDLQNQLQPENFNNGDDPTVESISYQNTDFTSDDASDREPLSETDLNENTQRKMRPIIPKKTLMKITVNLKILQQIDLRKSYRMISKTLNYIPNPNSEV